MKIWINTRSAMSDEERGKSSNKDVPTHPYSSTKSGDGGIGVIMLGNSPPALRPITSDLKIILLLKLSASVLTHL